MTELAFQHAVIAAGNLLGTQLLAVFGGFLIARLTMLAGSIGTAIKSTLAGVASLALQKELLSFAAAKSAHRTGISCHVGCTS